MAAACARLLKPSVAQPLSPHSEPATERVPASLGTRWRAIHDAEIPVLTALFANGPATACWLTVMTARHHLS